MPNLVSFMASIAELAHGEKSCTQSLTHPAYLTPQEPKLLLWNNNMRLKHAFNRTYQLI